MYRALALVSIENGLAPDDGEELERIARQLSLRLWQDAESDGGAFHITIDGREVTEQIREPEVTARVSEVSAHPGVREVIVEMQRAYAGSGAEPGAPKGLVAEGRDMGTVVFPAADVKFFMVASLEERARRRWAQLQAQGKQVSQSEIQEAIAERDRRDTSREVAPLAQAPDAETVETTGRTIEALHAALVARIEIAHAQR